MLDDEGVMVVVVCRSGPCAVVGRVKSERQNGIQVAEGGGPITI